MLRIRIAVAGAVLLAGIGGVAAQTETNGSPGKPLPLLQIVERPNKVTTSGHPHMAARVEKKQSPRVHLARRVRHAPARYTSAALAADDTSAADPAAPAPQPNPAFAAVPVPPPQPDPAFAAPAPVRAPDPRELVVNGQTVQVASPSDVNALDLAANDQEAAAAKAPAADVVQPQPQSQPEPQSQPDARAMVVAPSPEQPSQVGSAAWIAQVVAALGGAIAAGVVAWFLIGGIPQRMRG